MRRLIFLFSKRMRFVQVYSLRFSGISNNSSLTRKSTSTPHVYSRERSAQYHQYQYGGAEIRYQNTILLHGFFAEEEEEEKVRNQNGSGIESVVDMMWWRNNNHQDNQDTQSALIFVHHNLKGLFYSKFDVSFEEIHPTLDLSKPPNQQPDSLPAVLFDLTHSHMNNYFSQLIRCHSSCVAPNSSSSLQMQLSPIFFQFRTQIREGERWLLEEVMFDEIDNKMFGIYKQDDEKSDDSHETGFNKRRTISIFDFNQLKTIGQEDTDDTEMPTSLETVQEQSDLASSSPPPRKKPRLVSDQMTNGTTREKADDEQQLRESRTITVITRKTPNLHSFFLRHHYLFRIERHSALLHRKSQHSNGSRAEDVISRYFTVSSLAESPIAQHQSLAKTKRFEWYHSFDRLLSLFGEHAQFLFGPKYSSLLSASSNTVTTPDNSATIKTEKTATPRKVTGVIQQLHPVATGSGSSPSLFFEMEILNNFARIFKNIAQHQSHILGPPATTTTTTTTTTALQRGQATVTVKHETEDADMKDVNSEQDKQDKQEQKKDIRQQEEEETRLSVELQHKFSRSIKFLAGNFPPFANHIQQAQQQQKQLAELDDRALQEMDLLPPSPLLIAQLKEFCRSEKTAEELVKSSKQLVFVDAITKTRIDVTLLGALKKYAATATESAQQRPCIRICNGCSRISIAPNSIVDAMPSPSSQASSAILEANRTTTRLFIDRWKALCPMCESDWSVCYFS